MKAIGVLVLALAAAMTTLISVESKHFVASPN